MKIAQNIQTHSIGFSISLFAGTLCMRQRKICAPSNGGMGSKLKAPVNKFAAKKALHQMVARRERQKTAQTASKIFTPARQRPVKAARLPKSALSLSSYKIPSWSLQCVETDGAEKISHHVPHLVENCCQQPNAQKSACVKIKQNC